MEIYPSISPQMFGILQRTFWSPSAFNGYYITSYKILFHRHEYILTGIREETQCVKRLINMHNDRIEASLQNSHKRVFPHRGGRAV